MTPDKLLLVLLVTSTASEANVTLTVTNRTLPIGQLMTLTTLICDIDATFPINGTSIESRWQLPNGEEHAVNGPSRKYVITQGVTNGQFESVLLIQNIIYTDAGTYICRARDVRDPSNRGPWVEAPLTVELRVELVAVEPDIAVFDNETQVSLSCEMSLYLRPDQDLQWFRDGELISDSSARYSISYNDGTLGRGQFGGNNLGSSQLSTLVISQPLTSDSGTYTCSIRNTQHSQNIQLSVESSGLSNAPTVQPTTTATSKTSTTPPSSIISVSGTLPIIIGAIAGIVGIVLIVLIIIIIVLVSLWRRSHTTIARNYAVTLASSQAVVCDPNPSYEKMFLETVEPTYEEIPGEGASSSASLTLELNQTYGHRTIRGGFNSEEIAGKQSSDIIKTGKSPSPELDLRMETNMAYGGISSCDDMTRTNPSNCTTDAPTDQALTLETNMAYGQIEAQEENNPDTLQEVVCYI